ncbi:MAG TPA: sulfite exporter TauE/SafE family protein [bacterium]
MNTFEFTLITFAGAVVAGLLGSLTGLGGGVVITPMLTLLFGVDIRYAIGASLVTVIATSSGAAAAYVKEGFTNIRVGMFLEVATTFGALIGAGLAGLISPHVIAVIFGLVLIYSSIATLNPPQEIADGTPSDPLAAKLRLGSTYPTANGKKAYSVHKVGAGFSLMTFAGILSGLLGIGSGALKVLAMDRLMRLPFKVSTTTSNFMIGVTAAASAGVYLHRGYIDPALAFPIMLGTLGGATFGSRVLPKTRNRTLRIIFSIVIFGLAAEMMYNGFAGKM